MKKQGRVVIKKTFLFFAAILLLSCNYIFPAFNLQEEIRDRKIPTYIIENNLYISLKSLLRILNCEDSWGRVEDRIFIVCNGSEIKFRLDSRQVIFEKRTEYLSSPIKEREGEILIPVDDFGKILTDFKVKIPALEQKVEKSLLEEKNATVKKQPISLYSLPTEFEFKVNKRLWHLLWNSTLPPGKTAEEKVVQQVAREFSISIKDVDNINLKFFWYNQQFKKPCEDMTWQEFKKLRDTVSSPK